MRSSRASLALCICVVSLAAHLFSQQSPAPPAAATDADAKAAVTGTISDQKGGGVGGATVTMENGSAPPQTVTTDDQGLYAITDLASGPYTVSVVVHGTRVFRGNVTLSPGQVLTLSVAGAPVAQSADTKPGNPLEATKGSEPRSSPPASPAPPTPTEGQARPESGQVPTSATPPAAASAEPAPAESSPATSPGTAATATQEVSPPAQAPAVSTSPQVPVLAQSSMPPANCSGPGAIGGTVSDQSGGVLVGASVKVTSTTGAPQTAVSDDKGNYCFKGLSAGAYKITVAMKGFKVFEADGVNLSVGERFLSMLCLNRPEK